jgi:serine/threonine-protein kinase
VKVGRYLLYDEIASGGMAAVHFGRLVGDVGFSRTVAIKRLHAAYARDPDFVTMFLDEARLAARVAHPNVVQTVDVVALKDELFLVMEYVRGESLAGLLRACERDEVRPTADIAAAIVAGALHGLHAAHEAKDPNGALLGIVHRDMSPHNILVGADGVPRVLDFGIAKAITRLGSTRDGQLKGKLAYMAPEQIEGKEASRRSDIYAAGIVLWEALTGQRCFSADTPGALMALVSAGPKERPSAIAPGIMPALDDIVARATAHDPADRYESARQMAHALEGTGVASPSKVGAWVESLAATALEVRAAKAAAIDGGQAEEAADIGVGRPSFAEIGETTGSMPMSSPPRSSLTDITAAEGSAARSRRAKQQKTQSRTRFYVAGAVLAAVALGTGVWVAVSRSHESDAAAAVRPPETSAPAAPDDSASAPMLVVAASALPTASAEPAKKTIAAVRPPASGAPVRSAKPPAANCDPPYSLGPNGRHIPKAECL